MVTLGTKPPSHKPLGDKPHSNLSSQRPDNGLLKPLPAGHGEPASQHVAWAWLYPEGTSVLSARQAARAVAPPVPSSAVSLGHTHTHSCLPLHSRVTASLGSLLHLAEESPGKSTLVGKLGCWPGTCAFWERLGVLTIRILPFPDALGCHVLPSSWRPLLPIGMPGAPGKAIL